MLLAHEPSKRSCALDYLVFTTSLRSSLFNGDPRDGADTLLPRVSLYLVRD